MKLALNWNSFARGEDAVTAFRDPLSIPNGFCAVMDNVEPVDGRPKPRYGCSKLVGQGARKNVTWMGEYQKAAGGYIVWIDNGDLWARAFSGGEFIILAGWTDSTVAISSVRVGKYLVLFADQEDSCLVLEERGLRLVAFRGSIDNTGSPFSGAMGVLGSGDKFYVGHPRIMSHTWIRLPVGDAATIFCLPSGAATGASYGMPSAQLESWESLDYRLAPALALESIEGEEYEGRGDVQVNLSGITPPQGATHLRVYVTLGAPVTAGDTEAARLKAEGLVLRWLADIPLSRLGGSLSLSDYGSDYGLMGSTNLAWSTGADDPPPGSWVKFAGGRLWVGGGSGQVGNRGMQDNPGRAYHSMIMDGASDQLSRLLSFDYMNGYVDTSTDESEPCVGAGVSDGNLVLFNPSSVWVVRGASPDNEPQEISSLGAVGAVTEINQQIFYLSQEGPATISGSVCELIPFKSEAATPGIRGQSDFFQLGGKVSGIWHNDSWILTNGVVNAAYLMRGNDRGTWRITTGEPMSLLCHSFPRKSECWVGGGDKPFYRLMDPDAVMDGMTPFLARIYTKATMTPGKEGFGEAYAVYTNCRWTDTSALKVAVLGDHGRVADIYGFEEDHGTGSASLPLPAQRGPVLQGVMAGAASHWFQVGLEKYVWNVDTLFGEISLDILPRLYHPESISISDPGRPEPILDADFFGFESDTERG